MSVSVVDLDTLELHGCWKSVSDAMVAKEILEGNSVASEPDLFARCTVSLPPTLAW
jgi:hypothetical protein